MVKGFVRVLGDPTTAAGDAEARALLGGKAAALARVCTADPETASRHVAERFVRQEVPVEVAAEIRTAYEGYGRWAGRGALICRGGGSSARIVRRPGQQHPPAPVAVGSNCCWHRTANKRWYLALYSCVAF